MQVIRAVFKRNFNSYFSGVIGYLFIVAFVGLGAMWAFGPAFFGNNLDNLDQLNEWFPILLLFIVPAITMNAWSDERKQGTDELLFTLPATDLQILLGKYFAVLGVYSVALLFSFSHVFVLEYLGHPDLGLIFTTYFGYWVTGAALLSAGMVASILTNSAPVAYVLGAAFCAIPVFLDRLGPLVLWVLSFGTVRVDSGRWLHALSVGEQFRDFGLGMIPLGSLLYFVSFAGLMLYLNLVLISRRHWQGGPHQAPMGAHFLIRTAALAVALISLNVVAANASAPVDMTLERLYSLDRTTRDVLQEIKPERPVMVQAFISNEVPQELVPVRASLIGLLRQYDQVGGNRLRVRIVDTVRYSDAADEARRYGIEPQEMQTERAGKFVIDEVYLGVVVTGGVDDQVVIPFFDKGTPIEYELTRSIRTVSKAKRRTVGVLKTDAKVGGGFDMATFRNSPEWRIVTELKKQYDVKNEVGPGDLATSQFDVLIAAMPSSLTDPEVKDLIAYIKKGHPTLIIDDPFPMWHPGLAPKLDKPRMGGMFGGQQSPQKKADNGEATQLCQALEIVWDSGDSVWDLHDPHPNLTELLARLDVVYIDRNSGALQPFSEKSEITRTDPRNPSSGLQEIIMLYPGDLKAREDRKLNFQPLLRTSPRSFVLSWNEYVRQAGPFGELQPIAVDRRFPTEQTEHVVAAHITGKSSTARPNDEDPTAQSKDINVVFVADLDTIHDQFFLIREKQSLGLRLDNVTFILNAIDVLAGDEAYITLRSRRAAHRTLTRIERQTEHLRDEQMRLDEKADQDARGAVAEVQKSFAEELQRIRGDTSLDDQAKAIKVRTAQENETRRFEVQNAKIEQEKSKRKRENKDKTERQVRAIEQRTQLAAILLPPIPALLLGLYVFASRVQEERKGIVPERLLAKPGR